MTILYGRIQKKVSIIIKIIDDYTGEVIKDGMITGNHKRGEVINKKDGHYILVNIPKEQLTITIEKYGYKSMELDINMNEIDKKVENYIVRMKYNKDMIKKMQIPHILVSWEQWMDNVTYMVIRSEKKPLRITEYTEKIDKKISIYGEENAKLVGNYYSIIASKNKMDILQIADYTQKGYTFTGRKDLKIQVGSQLLPVILCKLKDNEQIVAVKKSWITDIGEVTISYHNNNGEQIRNINYKVKD